VELYTKFLKSRKAKDTEYMETITNLYWPHLRPLKLTDIKVFRLQEHHDKLAEKRGPGAARYAIACLSTLFNYAIRKELATYNPAVKVDVAGKTSREVFLDEYEISVMRDCLGEMAPTPRAYFLMALLTGARRENLEVPSVFRLPKGGFHATSFSCCCLVSQASMNCTGDL